MQIQGKRRSKKRDLTKNKARFPLGFAQEHLAMISMFLFAVQTD